MFSAPPRQQRWSSAGKRVESRCGPLAARCHLSVPLRGIRGADDARSRHGPHAQCRGRADRPTAYAPATIVLVRRTFSGRWLGHLRHAPPTQSRRWAALSFPVLEVSTHGFLQPRPWQLQTKRSWRATCKETRKKVWPRRVSSVVQPRRCRSEPRGRWAVAAGRSPNTGRRGSRVLVTRRSAAEAPLRSSFREVVNCIEAVLRASNGAQGTLESQNPKVGAAVLQCHRLSSGETSLKCFRGSHEVL